jgi:hypothetical protein
MVGDQAMTVYFIGAGPGAADLITVRGQRLLRRCPVCLYAGSIMPEDLLALCPPSARVIDTGPLNLDQIVTALADAHAAGLDVARRSTARGPNNAVASTRLASTTKSCPGYRRSRPPLRCWAVSSRCPAWRRR